MGTSTSVDPAIPTTYTLTQPALPPQGPGSTDLEQIRRLKVVTQKFW